MTVVEKVLALRSVPVFTGLRMGDVVAIARVAEHRRLAAGEQAYSADCILRELVVVVRGALLAEDAPAGSVIGVASLLKDQPLGTGILAGTDGADCLLVNKGHFFTVIHQCPEIVCGLIRKTPAPVEVSAFPDRSPSPAAGDALFA